MAPPSGIIGWHLGSSRHKEHKGNSSETCALVNLRALWFKIYPSIFASSSRFTAVSDATGE